MVSQNQSYNAVKVTFRKGSLLIKVILLAVLVLGIGAMLTLKSTMGKTKAETEALRIQAAELERENGKLRQYIEELGTVQGIVRIAQEELGLVEPDSIIFDPVKE